MPIGGRADKHCEKRIIHVLITLTQAPAGTIPSVAAAADDYFASIPNVECFEPETVELYDADARGLGCVRGLRYAIAAEAVAGLAAYGLWHLWHVLR